MAFNKITSISCLVFMLFACTKAEHYACAKTDNKKDEMEGYFKTAKDVNTDSTKRILAARMLDAAHRQKLNAILVQRLKNNYTASALYDTYVLSETGDEITLVEFQKIEVQEDQQQIIVPGKINGARFRVRMQIEIRLEKAKNNK